MKWSAIELDEVGEKIIKKSFKSPATRGDEIACSIDGAQINFTLTLSSIIN